MYVQYSARELLTQPPVRCAGLDQSTQVLTPTLQVSIAMA